MRTKKTSLGLHLRLSPFHALTSGDRSEQGTRWHPPSVFRFPVATVCPVASSGWCVDPLLAVLEVAVEVVGGENSHDGHQQRPANETPLLVFCMCASISQPITTPQPKRHHSRDPLGHTLEIKKRCWPIEFSGLWMSPAANLEILHRASVDRKSHLQSWPRNQFDHGQNNHRNTRLFSVVKETQTTVQLQPTISASPMLHGQWPVRTPPSMCAFRARCV